MPTPSLTTIELKQLIGNAPTTLSPIQEKLNAHIDTLVHMWWGVWWLTACILLAFLVRDYVKYKKNRG